MIKKIALSGLLTSLAFAFSYLEWMLPVQALIPIPGIKLGLANIVILFALFCLPKPYAFGIMIVRSLLQAALFGSVSGLLFSLSGGILSFLIMSILLRSYNRFFSIFGISIAGAACHNIGQMICACIYFHSTTLLFYLPVLLLSGILFGLLTGYLCRLVLAHSKQLLQHTFIS